MIGDVGKRRVSDSLRSEAPRLGYVLLDNVLLIDDQTTAQIDHLIVDRLGILVVETKNYGALIKGKSDDRFWTACYSGKGRRRERFLNPLRQNDRHREMLQRVLTACGRRLPADYVQSLVVFAGGNIANLHVDDFDALRVVPSTEMVEYLEARCGDFQPNPGALDAEQVADLVSLLKSLNKAQDPEVLELHAARVARATRRFGGFRRRPAPSRAAQGSFGSHVVYNQDGRYPDGSHFGPVHHPARRDSVLRPLLASLFALVLLWWLVAAGGVFALSDLFSSATTLTLGGGTRVERQVAPVASPQPALSYDSALALKRLKEVDPQKRRKLVNPSEPRLSAVNGLPTYTWQYLEKSSSSAVSVHEISITLDNNGQIVGVSGR